VGSWQSIWVEELEEFLPPAPSVAIADRHSTGDIQRRKQRSDGRAVRNRAEHNPGAHSDGLRGLRLFGLVIQLTYDS
jgi:hypothetical protein